MVAPRNLGVVLGRDRPEDEELMAMVAEGRPEEVVQDTFVALWRRAGTFDPRQGRPYSWLLRITRNKSIDGLRRRGSARRPRLVPQGMPELARGSESVEEEAGTAELRSIVGGALEELPRDQREVLEMAYLGGLSQREIAESTGVPLGTVKTRTRLALKKLREALRPLFGRNPVDPHGL